MFETNEQHTADATDFQLEEALSAWPDQNLALFTRACIQREQSTEALHSLLAEAPDIRDSIKAWLQIRWGLDGDRSWLRGSDGQAVSLTQASLLPFRLGAGALVPYHAFTVEIATALPQSTLTARQLLEQLYGLDFPTFIKERWVAYWNGRAAGTPVSRRAHALRHYRSHLLAACDQAFARGTLSPAQRRNVQIVALRTEAPDLLTSETVYAETLHLLTDAGDKHALPGALVFTSDEEHAGQVLYLPWHEPVVQAFAERTDLERYLLHRQWALWDLPGNELRPRNTIDYEMPDDLLATAFRQLMRQLRQRMLGTVGPVADGDVSASSFDPLAAADAYDAWRKSASWLPPTIDSEAGDEQALAIPVFDCAFSDLPLDVRLARVAQQFEAFQRVLGETPDPHTPQWIALQHALSALARAQSEAHQAGIALLSAEQLHDLPRPPDAAFAALNSARKNGLRAEADLQGALGSLPPLHRELIDAVLDEPDAARRTEPVVACSVSLSANATVGADQNIQSRRLDGVLVIGFSAEDSGIDESGPLLLYWPGRGGVAAFANGAELRQAVFKLPSNDGALQVTLTPLAGDAFEVTLNHQLAQCRQRAREIIGDFPGPSEASERALALAQLREDTLATLLVPDPPARQLAYEQLRQHQQARRLNHQLPDWLTQWPDATRERFAALIHRYKDAARRAQTFVQRSLPARNAFAAQQVSRQLRAVLGLHGPVRVDIDLPDSVRYSRDVIPGSGAPGTPVKLLLEPSAERSRIPLETLAMENIDDALGKRLQFMDVIPSEGLAQDRATVQAALTVDGLRRFVSELDLAARYESTIRATFLGAPGESAFHQAYREECLLTPLQLMLELQGEAALLHQRIDAAGQALFNRALRWRENEDHSFRLLPLLLTAGGADTDHQATGLAGVTLIRDQQTLITLLYLPDAPDGIFLRQYPNEESARNALFTLTLDTAIARYLASLALAGDVLAHEGRMREASLRHFDGIVAIGLAWPANTSLPALLSSSRMGRLITAHRATSRANLDLRQALATLQHGQVYDYLKMALGVVPFVGTAIALYDAWTFANEAVEAFRDGETGAGVERLESVLQSLIDALMDVLPGAGVGLPSSRGMRQAVLKGPHRRTTAERFRGYEAHPDTSLNGLAPGDPGTLFESVYRHPDGHFIVSDGKIYPVTFDQGRFTWRLSGKPYQQPIALDEAGQWDTHGAIYGVNIVSPVSGGGGALVRMADNLDPLWPEAIRQHLPRWWTDPTLRRRHLLRYETDRQLRELNRLNRLTGEKQRAFRRLTDDAERQRAALKLVNDFHREREIADAVYPELEALAQLSSGQNLRRARELQSQVAWVQVDRLTNELNTIKRAASEQLSQMDALIEKTASMPATDVAEHLQVMKRRKQVRLQIIEKLDAVSRLTHAVEVWSRRVTIAAHRGFIREDVDFALAHFEQHTCDILKVRHYLEVINRYDTATDPSWFFLQREVARSRVDVDRNLSNLFHLPEVRANAGQRKKMLQASIDSIQAYRRQLLAWNTSDPHVFDQTYVPPLLEQLQAVSDLAERWKQKVPAAAQPARQPGKGPSVARKLFETEDDQIFVGVEEDHGKPQQRFIIANVNNRTEVYVPGESGRWRLEVQQPSAPSTPVPLNQLLRDAQERIDKLAAYRERVLGYARQNMKPVDLEHLMLSEARELRTRAGRIIEQSPDHPLAVSMRAQADELVAQGRTLRIEHSVASHQPNGALLDYLREQGCVDIVKVGGLTKLQRRIDGQADFFQEYEVRLVGTEPPRPLWYAHFHYNSAKPRFAEFTKAHLKTASQRRLGLQWQIAQGETADRIWRGVISQPLAQKHFAELFAAGNPA